MASLKAPTLVLRSTKGAELTFSEVDGNFEGLRDFANALAKLLGVSLQASGALKTDSVGTDAIQDRSVTQRKLAFDSGFVLTDTGTVNSMAVAFTPAMAAYSDGVAILVKPKFTNTGAVFVNINGLGNEEVFKEGSKNLEAGDIIAGSIVSLVRMDSKWHLVAGSGGASGGGGGTTLGGSFSMLAYDPATQSLPGAASSVSFTHGLGGVPHMLRVGLENTDDELGYVSGDFVPLEEFFLVDADPDMTQPAFSTTVTPTAISVEQHSATIKVVDKSTNSPATIDTTKWAIKAVAGRAQNTQRISFPATQFMVSNPIGAMAYGKDMIVFQEDPNDDRLNLFSIDMFTNQVTHIETVSPVNTYDILCGAPWRLASADEFFYTTRAGLYKIDLQAGTGRTLLVASGGSVSANNLKQGRIAWIEDLANDTYFLINNNQDHNSGGGAPAGFRVDELQVRKLEDSAGYSLSNIGTLDFTHANIVNGADFRKFCPTGCQSAVILCQYNPVDSKRRIYLMENATGLLHIFNLSLASSNDISDWMYPAAVWGPDYTDLTYEKSIAVAGALSGDYSVVTSSPGIRGGRERITVEFDLNSGEEKSITLVRTGDDKMTGAIVRIPWKES